MNTVLLFVSSALIWGTTWLAIKFQLAAVSPEAGVAIRFLAAGLLLALFCVVRGIGLAFPARLHRLFMLQGLAGFSLSYLAVYHAEQLLVSGLVAIGYAASPLANLLLARVAFGTPMSRRVAFGGALGLVGIALIFLQELAHVAMGRELAIGAVLTMTAVILSGVAGLAATRYHQFGVHGWGPLAWAMFYGGAASTTIGLATGRSFAIAWSVPFAASLAFLVVGGSVLAFGAYLAVMRRIGLARASYVGVMSTVIAMAISSLFEGFEWTPWTVLGVVLALVGNVLALYSPGGAAARTIESAP